MSTTESGDWTGLLTRDKAQEWEAAFSLLVNRQSQFVFKVAYAVLRNTADAEDVVQETFLKLFKTGAWSEIQDERRFLARMAWRLAVARVSKKPVACESEPVDIASGDTGPESAAILTEQSRTVHRLIDALPAKLRMPLVLSSIEEMTTPEIAAVMGTPEGTVRRLLVEARALVKAKLARMESNSHE